MSSKNPAARTGTRVGDLQTALKKLKPSGADGFEGLLAAVFTKIAQVDFRLAKSGLQGGKDGSTLASEIGFEAKRYDDAIPAKDVLSKITQLIAGPAMPRLWVLGATVEVGTQLADTLKAAADRIGLSVMVLDWPGASSLPPLAVACAMAPEEVVAFLHTHVTDKNLVAAATAQLRGLAKLEGFQARATALERQLKNPTLGMASAQQANARWLAAAFADRQRARSIFGQALAPDASHAMPTQDRQPLVDHVVDALARTEAPAFVAILGREGHGKSWLFAQGWKASAKPLALLLPAGSFKSVTTYGDIGALLTDRFVEQTGSDLSDEERRRWKFQLAEWGPREPGERPRFIVCVDGLNERPDIDWPRWLEGVSGWIAEHGGLLVVTAREAYFRDRVRSALIAPVETITVPEWSEEELKSILALKKVDAAKLRPEVFERLRNPRLLGIAFELLDSAQVEAFSELTVDHLLFEHIRAGAQAGNAPEPVEWFVKRLADHAREIISRAEQQQIEDRLIFEQDASGIGRYELTPDLIAVTAEHFYRPLAEDPTLYELSSDGLTLALGLAIIKALQTAERSGRSIAEALDVLLDPIEALDKTAEAVFAAVLVASVDQSCSISIQRALIGRVLKLQNLDQERYPAFVAVVRNATDAAMWTVYDIGGTEGRVASQDWLITALRQCRNREDCWGAMSVHMQRWLRTFSDDPRLGHWADKNADPDKTAKDLEERTERLTGRQAALSAGEVALLATMQRETLDPAELHGPALEMLAGMPLVPFAQALVCCAFSMSFNASIHSPYEAFSQLVRFNRQDWIETRDGLLDAVAFARAEDASVTAQWALVQVLRATSTPADADEEHALVEALTADRERFEGWRLIEDYCATDPCDPAASRPGNVDETAERYAEINVDELNRQRSMTQADHFFNAARPGVARFALASAILVHQRFALSLGKRDNLSKWLALTELKQHAALIDPEGVTLLKELAVQHAKPYDKSNRDERDEWLVSQYALLVALPHLDGEEQVALLARLPDHGAPLLDLQETFRPSSPESAEKLLARSIESGDQSSILMALSYLYGSGMELNAATRRVVGKLVSNEAKAIRGLAMAVALGAKDREIIDTLVKSGWSAAALDHRENFYEVWYGSHLLIQAVKLGLMGAADLLERIAPKAFGAAVSVLPPEALAGYLHQAIGSLATHPILLRPPLVEEVVPESSEAPAFLSLVHVPEETQGAKAFFKQLSETPEEFDAKQRAGWKSFNEFQKALTKEQARLAIENVGMEAVEAYVKATPRAAGELARSIIAQPAGQLHSVVNFGLMLSKALSFHDASLATELFIHLTDEEPFVRLIFDPSGIALDAICLWGSADCAEVEELRHVRLDRAVNDHELSQEVLAALQQGKAEAVQTYAAARLQSQIPDEIARGLMVLGFGDEAEAAEHAFEAHWDTKGFIGGAVKAARDAYDRNRWSRHWFEQMAAATTPEAFWQPSVQFLKIVDGRVSLWARNIERLDMARRFGPLLKSAMKHRIAKWKPEREKMLLGSKTPAEVYTATG